MTTLPQGLRGHYQLADNAMTLREGLAEYYRVNPGLTEPEQVEDPVMKRYFRCHDATHVFFGTHTGKLDEGVNDLLTLFAVDVSYVSYIKEFAASQEGQEIGKQYAEASTVTMLLKTLGLLPRIWRVSRAIHQRWPWEPDAHYDTPLNELRDTFGYALIAFDRPSAPDAAR